MKDSEFLGRMQKIEALTREIEALPDANARAMSLELMQLLMEYHGAAIERVMEIIAADEAGDRLFDELAADELANSLLLLRISNRTAAMRTCWASKTASCGSG
jgi:hypothetical protein